MAYCQRDIHLLKASLWGHPKLISHFQIRNEVHHSATHNCTRILYTLQIYLRSDELQQRPQFPQNVVSWCLNGDDSDLYLNGAKFGYRLGCRLSWLKVWSLSSVLSKLDENVH
jgi:hypothetical protein